MNWHRTPKELSRTFTCKTFPLAMQFVQEIGHIAEAQDHHPDIDIRYRDVTIRTRTHSEGNRVTEKDEMLTSAINHVSKAYLERNS